MNSSTLLGRPLLLVAVLAVSWAAAVPIQVSGNEGLIEDPQTFLKQHPSIARELFPDLLDAASDVNLFLNRDAVSDILRNYLAEEEVQLREGHERRRRDTSRTTSLDVTHQTNLG